MSEDKKLRIAIFSDTVLDAINGVATSVSSLKEILETKGHKVYLFIPGKKTYFDKEKRTIYVHGKRLKKIYNYRAALPFHIKVRKMVKELNIDLIHVNTEWGIGLIGYQAAHKYKIPLVYTYHTKLESYTYYIFKHFLENHIKKLLRKVTKKYVNSATEVIVPSLDTKEYLESCGVKKFINVVPTGIEIDRFNLSEKEHFEYRNKIRNFYKIDDNCKVILCLGRLAQEKSFDFAIERFAKYRATHENALKLMFVGDGPYLETLKQQAECSGCSEDILFVGKIEQQHIQHYYTAADVFLNCSTSETQGLTYMEAMASRLIILTRKADYLNGVIDDREDGFYFETQDQFDASLDEILSLDEKRKNEILDNASSVVTYYSLENFYNNIMVAYNRALSKEK